MAGFTITGGVSFSGAVSMSDAPPPDNTAAWFGGGYSGGNESRVDRIIFATDTATASVRGPLSVARGALAATGNTYNGWFAGGQNSSYVTTSTVDRITFATDTATASVRGPLSGVRLRLAAAGNTYDGWFAGGSASWPTPVSTVERITYEIDTATATVRGPLSLARYNLGAAGNTTDGWFVGGSPGAVSTVQRITYATDTATASVRGPLSSVKYGVVGTGNSTDGWFAGGVPAASPGAGVPGWPYTSTVERITYATDTATASVRGPLNLYQGGVTFAGATGNPTVGWFGGGNGPYAGNSNSPGPHSTVDRITYATDTATASSRGPLSVARTLLTAAGGVQ